MQQRNQLNKDVIISIKEEENVPSIEYTTLSSFLGTVRDNALLIFTSAAIGSVVGAFVGHFIASIPSSPTPLDPYDDEITGAYFYSEHPTSAYHNTVILASSIGASIFTSISTAAVLDNTTPEKVKGYKLV